MASFPSLTESQHQQAVIKWAAVNTGNYPELKWLYAIPNGANTALKNKVRLLAEGLKPGVSDLHLPVRRADYIGLWIEMKSSKGKLSEDQKTWLVAMHELGHYVAVCRSWRAAVNLLKAYLDLKDAQEINS